jgi:tRNA-Thr(GGU) m(6)t(6)A37 methyltransferase TsaA
MILVGLKLKIENLWACKLGDRFKGVEFRVLDIRPSKDYSRGLLAVDGETELNQVKYFLSSLDNISKVEILVNESARARVKWSDWMKKLIDYFMRGVKMKIAVKNGKEGTGKSIEEIIDFSFKKIGIIHTPYTNNAPYQPVENDEGKFSISLDSDYLNGLKRLAEFNYIYVIYYMHRLERDISMTVYPPWAQGEKVGLFASRSPLRPNPIGLSVVKIRKIIKNKIYTSGLDVFDGTPLLDIKPYLKDLDSKADANYGWVDELVDKSHLTLHIKGIPHEY